MDLADLPIFGQPSDSVDTTRLSGGAIFPVRDVFVRADVGLPPSEATHDADRFGGGGDDGRREGVDAGMCDMFRADRRAALFAEPQRRQQQLRPSHALLLRPPAPPAAPHRLLLGLLLLPLPPLR